MTKPLFIQFSNKEYKRRVQPLPYKLLLDNLLFIRANLEDIASRSESNQLYRGSTYSGSSALVQELTIECMQRYGSTWSSSRYVEPMVGSASTNFWKASSPILLRIQSTQVILGQLLSPISSSLLPQRDIVSRLSQFETFTSVRTFSLSRSRLIFL